MKAVALVAVLSVAVLALLAGSSHDVTDAAIKKRFLKHRADFEKLVKIAEEDRHLVRIANDFTWLDTDASWPRKDVGISQERWNEYRRLFRRVGAPVGIFKDQDSDPPKIFFPIFSRGLVPYGDDFGVVYSPAVPAPLVKSLDQKPPAELYDKKGHILVYWPIAEHWYKYYEAW